MSTMIRRTILAGALTGMMASPFVGTAFAEPPSPSPTDSSSSSPDTPMPDTHLDVTISPVKVEPGATVNIKAVAAQGQVPASPAAHSEIFDQATLTTSGNVAAGTGHVRSDAKAGSYEVLVVAMTPEALKLQGTSHLTVVVTGSSPPPTSPAPSTPRGGVGAGGGGTAGRVDLTTVGAGSAIALLGVTGAVAAMMRRKSIRH